MGGDDGQHAIVLQGGGFRMAGELEPGAEQVAGVGFVGGGEALVIERVEAGVERAVGLGEIVERGGEPAVPLAARDR